MFVQQPPPGRGLIPPALVVRVSPPDGRFVRCWAVGDNRARNVFGANFEIRRSEAPPEKWASVHDLAMSGEVATEAERKALMNLFGFR